MPQRNQVNYKDVLKDLEKKISPILVVNNSSLKPYVELFEYAPENIYQQPLGNLVGFFEIKEYSEDSAYVVNFLTSVLKKEYYINPKRPVTESLDSALHKVNLALSELAKHGNIEWLGKLNAAICVLEKNNTHFSVTGNAKIFLYRNTVLTDISEDLAADPSEPHPLKTFVNVSSGRLEKDDRLLITSEDIFHIFSTLDLKKNLGRFEGEKFIQFLKTALSNQMEMIASVVVDMSEQEVEAPVKKTFKPKAPVTTTNVFSEAAFASTAAKAATTVAGAAEEALDVINLPEEETEYTDKKTGHIYVQGETGEPIENSKMDLALESAKEKLSEAWYLTKNETKRKFNIYKKQLAKKLEQRRIEKERLALEKEAEMERLRQEEEIARKENEKRLVEEKEAERILFEQQELERQEIEALEAQEVLEMEQIEKENQLKLEEEARKIKPRVKKIIPTIIEDEKPQSELEMTSEEELSFQEKLQLAIEQQKQAEKQKNITQRQAVIDLRAPKTKSQQIESFFAIEEEIIEEETSEEELPVAVHQQAEINEKLKQEKIDNAKKKAAQYLQAAKMATANLYKISTEKTLSFIKNRKANFGDDSKAHLSPRFSKIKNNFHKFSHKQKLYTLLILALVFIVPFFIARSLNKPQKPVANIIPEKPLTQADILKGEKNIKTGLDAKTVIAKSDLNSNILMTNLGIIAFTKNSVLTLDKNNQPKEFQIPGGEGSIAKATFMNDLSLVLIVTDQNKVISFSPISQKFTDNNINLSGKSTSELFGTYLTYMYVLNPEDGQVYRFPRADGGFGEKTNWLKSQADFSKASSMTIDDSLWVTDGKKITKYFKGAQQEIKFEASATSVNYDLVYTNLDSTSLYVLDKLNSRLVVFAKDSGNIISQYNSEKLKDATAFTIDEKNKTAYAVTSSGLISISIQ